MSCISIALVKLCGNRRLAVEPGLVDSLSEFLACLLLRSSCHNVRQTWFPEPWDPKHGTPNSGLSYFYGVDYRALWWIHFFGSSQGSGFRTLSETKFVDLLVLRHAAAPVKCIHLYP